MGYRVIMPPSPDDGRPSTDDVYAQFSDYVELNGMSQLLKDAKMILKIYPAVRMLLKRNYPQNQDQITLWEKLHGYDVT